MNIELARTFLEIVAAGSFIRAAERLHVTQTAVSARVKQLEEQLGRPLFVRNRAGASLTAAGQQFLRYAQTLVQVWERARHQVAVPIGYTSVLAIGSEFSLWSPLLLNWLMWIRRTEPEIAVRASVASADQLQDQVIEGTLDLVVMYAPRYQSGLEVELLLEERLIMVTTTKKAATKGRHREKNYVHVDWGPQFAIQYGIRFPDRPEPSVFVGHGPLGLQYLLQVGGTGYFRYGVIKPYLDSGRLRVVPRAPEFIYPAHAVYSENADPTLVQKGLEGLRQVARIEESAQIE